MQYLYPAVAGELSDDDLAELYAFPVDDTGGRPWVRANFVSTVDGAAQGANLRSATISNPPDQRIFALLRSLCDVIITGAGTTRVEGYQPVKPNEAHTTVRALHGLAPLPAIAVVSRSLDVDPDLIRGAAAPTIVLTVESAPLETIAAIRQVAPVIVAGEHDVDLGRALSVLSDHGYRRMLCEGGPTLMRGLVASDRLDDLCITYNPVLAAGDRLRITSGPDLDPPRRLALQHLLMEDGELFARYSLRALASAD
ncbi:MAG: pyrimidine reductase family protein [Nocardioidaceae bacterium]